MGRKCVVLLAVVLTACTSDANADTTTTEVEATTTIAVPPASATLPPTTTTLPPPTTTLAESLELDAVTMVLQIEGSRDNVIEIISGLSDVESLNKYEFAVTDEGDFLSLRMTLDVTSAWRADDNQHEGAWAITRVMSIMWEEGEGVLHSEFFLPAFQLTNSGRSYECSGEFMARLADTRASQADWEAECA